MINIQPATPALFVFVYLGQVRSLPERSREPERVIGEACSLFPHFDWADWPVHLLNDLASRFAMNAQDSFPQCAGRSFGWGRHWYIVNSSSWSIIIKYKKERHHSAATIVVSLNDSRHYSEANSWTVKCTSSSGALGLGHLAWIWMDDGWWMYAHKRTIAEPRKLR